MPLELRATQLCKSADIGKLGATVSIICCVFATSLMIYSQLRSCNSSGFSYSWMMSSYVSNTACGAMTIVALCVVTFGAQVLVFMACGVTLMQYEAHAPEAAALAREPSPYAVGLKLRVQDMARLGIAMSTVSGYSLMTVILFPAYGRGCSAGGSALSPLLKGWHEVAVGIFFFATGASLSLAGS